MVSILVQTKLNKHDLAKQSTEASNAEDLSLCVQQLVANGF